MKLNGIPIPTPENDIQIDLVEIARISRTASARLTKDILAVKARFTIIYNGLLTADALTFINVFKVGKPVIFEYKDVEGVQTKEVYISSLPRSIYNPKPEYTKNITITLEEV